jgi:transposase-like protein
MTKPMRDWAPIEAAYRTDTATISELARRFDISDTAIRIRAKKQGLVRDHPFRRRAAAPASDVVATLDPHRSLTALIKLYDKLRKGLQRVVEGKAAEHEVKLLSKAGGGIDAFNALTVALAKLIQLERLALDGEGDGSVPELAERLRAAQRAMAALSRGAEGSPASAAAETDQSA